MDVVKLPVCLVLLNFTGLSVATTSSTCSSYQIMRLFCSLDGQGECLIAMNEIDGRGA